MEKSLNIEANEKLKFFVYLQKCAVYKWNLKVPKSMMPVNQIYILTFLNLAEDIKCPIVQGTTSRKWS